MPSFKRRWVKGYSLYHEHGTRHETQLIYYDTYYKMRQISLQNATAILLHNATKCIRFFVKKCDSYHKMQRSLQIAAVQKAFTVALT